MTFAKNADGKLSDNSEKALRAVQGASDAGKTKALETRTCIIREQKARPVDAAKYDAAADAAGFLNFTAYAQAQTATNDANEKVIKSLNSQNVSTQCGK